MSRVVQLSIAAALVACCGGHTDPPEPITDVCRALCDRLDAARCGRWCADPADPVCHGLSVEMAFATTTAFTRTLTAATGLRRSRAASSTPRSTAAVPLASLLATMKPWRRSARARRASDRRRWSPTAALRARPPTTYATRRSPWVPRLRVAAKSLPASTAATTTTAERTARTISDRRTRSSSADASVPARAVRGRLSRTPVVTWSCPGVGRRDKRRRGGAAPLPG